VEETLFPSLVGRRRNVLGYEFSGLWADIGTPARYRDLNVALAARPGAVSEDCRAGEGAVIDLSVVGPGCAVAGGASVLNSVLWENVDIGEGARVSGCILADGVTVGAGAVVDGVVVASGATIAPHAVIPRGTNLEPGARYDARP
jgi:mannose-1-phosphate guanylyltransferase